ncbi:MAG: hypothetical protein AB8I08_02500 [Sandaracinaceae bacterium]
MARSPHFRSRLFALMFVMLSAGVFVSAWRSRDAESTASAPAPPCPFGGIDQTSRSEGLLHALRATSEGAALLDELGHREVRLCFSEDEHFGVVSDDRVLLLPSGESDPVLASRVGHLLDHVAHGMPFPAEPRPDASCDALIETALSREARAYGLEVRLRRSLGEVAPRYEFEADLLQAPEDERSGIIMAYLRAHPDGAPNLDALVTGYRSRCP